MHLVSWKKMCKLKKEGGLGFRDLRGFILALLAKQCWRIIQALNYVLAKVLKGKILSPWMPNGSRVETPTIAGLAKLNERAEPPFLKASMAASIGNERVTSLHWVSQLIDGSSGLWKEELVKSMFCSSDAELILSLPISITGAQDRLISHSFQSEEYTVKCGYYIAQGVKEQTLSSDTMAYGTRQFWNELVWGLLISSKIKKLLMEAFE
ncbi:conserved hypothetical protein [Ricinus communis]|uniref:Uncharacterized protein n=1 Tax=Ricinus communis TaxID=3988 RepID=B9RPR7_RICCO|nr:conserved hypothetical protein [Ricinus communis]